MNARMLPRHHVGGCPRGLGEVYSCCIRRRSRGSLGLAPGGPATPVCNRQGAVLERLQCNLLCQVGVAGRDALRRKAPRAYRLAVSVQFLNVENAPPVDAIAV